VQVAAFAAFLLAERPKDRMVAPIWRVGSFILPVKCPKIGGERPKIGRELRCNIC
jgi:hypothetical protein